MTPTDSHMVSRCLIIEMMERWKIPLSYGAKKEVGEIRLENGIIQGDAFSPLLFVLMIDPLIKILKKRVGDGAETLYYMDDLKASMTSIGTSETIHETSKNYASSVGMVINAKKNAIQLSIETPIQSLSKTYPEWTRRRTNILGLR